MLLKEMVRYSLLGSVVRVASFSPDGVGVEVLADMGRITSVTYQEA